MPSRRNTKVKTAREKQGKKKNYLPAESSWEDLVVAHLKRCPVNELWYAHDISVARAQAALIKQHRSRARIRIKVLDGIGQEYHWRQLLPGRK